MTRVIHLEKEYRQLTSVNKHIESWKLILNQLPKDACNTPDQEQLRILIFSTLNEWRHCRRTILRRFDAKINRFIKIEYRKLRSVSTPWIADDGVPTADGVPTLETDETI